MIEQRPAEVNSLCEVVPEITIGKLMSQLVPPPEFTSSRFDNYRPDPGFPSQLQALEASKQFVTTSRRLFNKTESTTGVYLDGGFGVGKTHLLASMWHEYSGKKVFGSFLEYTSLIGYLGFAEAVKVFSDYRLICIDEFELDDPGDTVLMSTLLNRLVEQGTNLAATSNTLPDRLGEDRFAADDFIREIQGLAAHFEVLRIDGPDYRHRENESSAVPTTEAQLLQGGERESFDFMSALDAHLQKVHPSAYAKLFDGVAQVNVANLFQLTNQANALRWVVFIDRMYDLEIPFAYSGEVIDQLFSAEMKTGGYRKKYFRALSRLSALSREAKKH